MRDKQYRNFIPAIMPISRAFFKNKMLFTVFFLFIIFSNSIYAIGVSHRSARGAGHDCISRLYQLQKNSWHPHSPYRFGKHYYINGYAENFTRDRSIKILALNTFEMALDHIRRAPRRGARNARQRRRESTLGLSLLKRNLANYLYESDSDIIFLSEIIDKEVPFYLNREFLNNEYKVVMTPETDPYSRLTFLIRKNLGLDFQIHSFSRMTSLGNANDPIFARDFPLLEARIAGRAEDSTPLFTLGGVHLKAHRNTPSTRTRRREIRAIRDIYRMIESRYEEDVPFLVAGDFNRNFLDQHLHDEFVPLIEDLGLRDTLDLAPPSEVELASGNSRHSYLYFDRDNSLEYLQLDAILASPSLQESNVINAAGIGRILDENGNEYRRPRNKRENRQRPSDHNPVWMELDLARL